MLYEIIQERIAISGVSQAKLAETIGCTPAQLSLYLRGKASLNNECLEKCIEVLDINIDSYHKRLEIAKKVAEVLKNKKMAYEKVLQIEKKEMIALTGIEELEYLIDADGDKLGKMITSGIVDYDSTYPYFRVIVAHLVISGEKPTPKVVENSVASLYKTISSYSQIPLIGGIIGASIIGGLAFTACQLLGRSGGFLSPMLSLTLQSLKKKN